MDTAILIRDLDHFRQARPVWGSAAETTGTTGDAADAEARRQRLVPRELVEAVRAKELIA